jgi:hypothetical protein
MVVILSIFPISYEILCLEIMPFMTKILTLLQYFKVLSYKYELFYALLDEYIRFIPDFCYLKSKNLFLPISPFLATEILSVSSWTTTNDMLSYSVHLFYINKVKYKKKKFNNIKKYHKKRNIKKKKI